MFLATTAEQQAEMMGQIFGFAVGATIAIWLVVRHVRKRR